MRRVFVWIFLPVLLVACLAYFLRTRALATLMMARLQLATCTSACTSYYATCGEWPASLDSLSHNNSNFVFLAYEGAPGPIRDPWGGELQFKPFDPLRGYGSIGTFGPKGTNGGILFLELRFGRPGTTPTILSYSISGKPKT